MSTSRTKPKGATIDGGGEITAFSLLEGDSSQDRCSFCSRNTICHPLQRFRAGFLADQYSEIFTSVSSLSALIDVYGWSLRFLQDLGNGFFHSFLRIRILALSFIHVPASDPGSLQDFCVADETSNVLVNGLACKDPKRVRADDFFFSGLHLAGNTSNAVGCSVATVTAAQIPGLNTLGISLSRGRVCDIRSLKTVSSQKFYKKGDVFVFPIGLLHFQRNVWNCNAVAIAALSSQNPGVVTIANAMFGSTPEIPSDILVKAFQLDKNVVDSLRSKF
ncbi:hypothetical protein OIU77_008578 [Salix suchowensis]|uniref:Germin-like protein n=1 Tax=Salix suchowensis TaxID=1278906 RepID=A0ABQ9ABC8_9ROSI|nr:hypothetical protein OIU77_008578 [Salix suchowensis]